MLTKKTPCCAFERRRRMFWARFFVLSSDYKFVAGQEQIMYSLDSATVEEQSDLTVFKVKLWIKIMDSNLLVWVLPAYEWQRIFL